MQPVGCAIKPAPTTTREWKTSLRMHSPFRLTASAASSIRWLSTNDWAGYLTSQWQPGKRTALTLAMRRELQQFPPPLTALHNPDLPITGKMPGLGNQWGPRIGFAWGAAESRWPVVRLGYGMYFSRTRNSLVETAL